MASPMTDTKTEKEIDIIMTQQDNDNETEPIKAKADVIADNGHDSGDGDSDGDSNNDSDANGVNDDKDSIDETTEANTSAEDGDADGDVDGNDDTVDADDGDAAEIRYDEFPMQPTSTNLISLEPVAASTTANENDDDDDDKNEEDDGTDIKDTKSFEERLDDSFATVVKKHVKEETDNDDSEENQTDLDTSSMAQHEPTVANTDTETDTETKVDTPQNNNSGESSSTSPMSPQDESILIELQASLQHQMTLRAEVENKLRNQAAEIDQYKRRLEEYSGMEDMMEQANANLTRVVAERVNLEQEVGRLRDGRDDLERKEALLNNRLNDAKKKEASKSNTAGRLERENEELKQELEKMRGELKSATAQKEKVEHSIEKLKKKCVERVKMTEAALVEERNLNEERKKKMKVFVETKAEDLRNAKAANDELRTELKDTSAALQTVRGKLEHVTHQFDNAATKNRELTREISRMKKNAEQMLTLGDNLEFELHKSAQETEEHKNKRLTAKHELMTILRKLEAEQAVNSKLRDSIKFTFTPKALSQQQLLNESLQDLESELFKLASRLGKTLLPSAHAIDGMEGYGDAGTSSNGNSNGSLDGRNGSASSENGNKKSQSRSEWDASRLLSSLESETQHVSKGIMAFSNSVERLRTLLDDSGEKTCASTLNEIFNAIAAARADGATPMSSASGNFNEDDEDGSFVGGSSQTKRGPSRSSEKYGLVPGGN